jgi:catalase
VLSYRVLPRSYRMMEGFGVHTFRLVDEAGTARFVKFHWRPTLGTASLVWDEAQKLQGKDPDFNRRDLWEAIENGDYPEFELGLQVVEEEDEFRFDFDLLDPTKIIPEADVPVQIVGKMTLNRNPDNFFAETEQVAFHPGHVVPGIDFTNDPLLQGRLFSYLDTQLIRLGGPNFAELPINRPVAPVHNNQRDGYGRQAIHRGRVAYSPNSLAGGCPMTASAAEGAFVHHAERVDGRKVRARSDSFQDHFSQATMFWHSISAPEQDHLVEAAHFELGKVETMAVRERMVHEFFNRIDHQLAVRVAQGIGVEPPTVDLDAPVTKLVPEVGVEARKRTDSIATRKVAILAADGYEHTSLTAVRASLEAKGARCEVVAKRQGRLRGEGGDTQVDKSYVVTASVMYDAVLIAGGRESVEALRRHGDALHFVLEAFRHGKAIGALGEAVDLLADARIASVDGADRTPEGVAILAGAAEGGDARAFAERFAAMVGQYRHWEREQERVPA